MKLKAIYKVKTKEQAQKIAMNWQGWASCQSLSYDELAQYQSYFETLGYKFNLISEFKENCII